MHFQDDDEISATILLLCQVEEFMNERQEVQVSSERMLLGIIQIVLEFP